MLLYKDIISDDEMFTDAFPIKEVDGVIYEVDCQLITIKPDADADVGANPSSEEQGKALEGTTQVNNVVYSFHLQPTTFQRSEYLTHIKDYLKILRRKLEESAPDRIKAFEEGANTFVKKVLTNFGDYEFYIGATRMDNFDCMVALLNHREDGVTPYLTFWKDGLKEVEL